MRSVAGFLKLFDDANNNVVVDSIDVNLDIFHRAG